MFAQFTVFITTALAASSLASTDVCNTGLVQCCGALAAPSTVAATNALSLVGVAVQDITALVGLECSPITAIGVGSGAACSTSPVCCDKNVFNQGVGVNCSPVTVQA
ncbi:unnamed protein product [Cyclocybe aegerita]|uniref:Hydrophobin n=1 Tax=Cyclocybe aegerita TaxID=1973307 RepID=A0A8S0WZ84_CYCAE|nr:unnamed protein product [Cyclocybe aegerita]